MSRDDDDDDDTIRLSLLDVTWSVRKQPGAGDCFSLSLSLI